MAKLTKEQAKKWNDQLGGGFYFDWKHYAIWSEKLARRNIDLKDGKVLQITLEYNDVKDEAHPYIPTGKVQPHLHFQVWSPTATGMMSSNGFGKSIEIGTQQDKRNWKELCKLSANYDDEKLFALAVEQLGELERAEVA